jgi:hypothetical protein
MFADTLRSWVRECDREGFTWNSMERDTALGILAEIDALKAKLGEANKKWTVYEQEYILPVFDLMQEAGVDLRALVKENPGQNCVILAIKRLIADREKSQGVRESTQEIVDEQVGPREPAAG